MEAQKLAKFKSQLDEQRQRLTELLERTGKHLYRRDEPYSADFAEQAVEVENNQVVEALDDNAKTELDEIKAALERIENGTFGACLKCGDEILEARLDLIPYARFCTSCAE
ncbi:MAG: TraR/DksA family transcriptional regulator [Gammaproteobacteria bacterium]